MCEQCGCGEVTSFHHHEIEPKRIKLEEEVLSKNDRLAERNRGIFEAMKVVVLNLVSSPGAGKTTLLEQTIRNLKNEMNIGDIEGDQQTDRDAKRIESLGFRVHQLNTFDTCHLDAHMVRHALDNFPLNEIDLLFIENVGNLICPGAFDLGENFRIVVLSITEGEDKPIKYPGIFLDSPLVLINKIDLLEVLEFDLDQCLSYVKKVNNQAQCLCVSAKTGQGMESWYEWIKQKVKERGIKSQ